MTTLSYSRRFHILLAAVLLVILLTSRASAAVTLIGFTIEAEEDQVRIAWVTGTEFDNAGFRVLRKAGSDGEGDSIEVYFPEFDTTTDFIPALGDSVSGAEYLVFDQNAEPGTTYFYKLEDVANDNQTTIHDPDPLSVTIPSDATPTHTPTPTSTPTATSSPSNTPAPTATRTNTPQPTRTNTPAPATTPTVTDTPQPATSTAARTSTRIPAATTGSARTATPTWTPRSTATESDAGAAVTQANTPSPTPSRTPTSAADSATAYPPPVETAPATTEAVPRAPTPTAPPALANAERPNVEVPLAIVKPPAGFDLLAFFGRVLTILIATLTVAFIGASVWFIRIS